MNTLHHKPSIIPARNIKRLRLLRQAHPEIMLVDNYLDQLHELFQVSHPKQKADQNQYLKFISKHFGSHPERTGNWIYFPWNNTCVHLLSDSLFQTVRTARNIPLITKPHQQKYSHMVVGIVGLSVGSSIALTLAQSGGANTLKLADFDTLSLSNLNRIKASTIHLGVNKAQLIARQIYEINPYAHLVVYPKGINPQNLTNFFLKSPRINLVIDEADDILTKKYLRSAANAAGIPLIMSTDNGFISTNSIIKPQRHVKTPQSVTIRSHLNRIAKQYALDKSPVLSDSQKLLKIVSLVGEDEISHEMQQGSMQKIKNQIAGWPQLAITAFMGGSLVAFIVLLLATKQKTKTKQTSFSFLDHLSPEYHTKPAQKRRLLFTQKFKQFLKTIPKD